MTDPWSKTKIEKIRDPWLIQRCTSQDFNPSMKSSEYLRLDYMGSAEFEFGALPAFQRLMHSIAHKLVIQEVVYKDQTYFVMVDADRLNDYIGVMHKLVDESVRTKEGVRLRAKETIYVGKSKKAMYDQPHAPFQYDCWWDLTNTAAFARKRETLENLKVTMANSVRFMDSQKEKR